MDMWIKNMALQILIAKKFFLGATPLHNWLDP